MVSVTFLIFRGVSSPPAALLCNDPIVTPEDWGCWSLGKFSHSQNYQEQTEALRRGWAGTVWRLCSEIIPVSLQRGVGLKRDGSDILKWSSMNNLWAISCTWWNHNFHYDSTDKFVAKNNVNCCPPNPAFYYLLHCCQITLHGYSETL